MEVINMREFINLKNKSSEELLMISSASAMTPKMVSPLKNKEL